MRSRPRFKKFRNWSLRGQIVVGVLALFVVLCTSIGLFAGVFLRHSLIDRMDGELAKAGQRIGPPAIDRQNGTAQPTQDFNRRLGFPASPNQVTLVKTASFTDAVVQREVVRGVGTSPNSNNLGQVPLSATVKAVLLAIPADDRPRSINLPGLGSYRVVAHASPDSTAASRFTFVTGLPLSTVNDTVTRLTFVLLGLTFAGLVIAAFVVALLVNLALRPLHRVTATASRVAELPLDEGEVALGVRVADPNPHTEVGQVGVALNRMLENVNDALTARHRSEMQVRQFVADASHELRTPLASIRGYAELTRRSREVAPPDIAHAMARVESEAKRMTTLVEDLLLLARLDAGRSLDQLDVDLTSLTIDVLSDAHIAGPEHLWHLRVPDEPVMVSGDPARLHQVLGNLLANARTHTPAGTNVTVGLAVHAGRAILTVADDGPGIAPELLGQIFERFSRGEESRSRAAGSTGLGLAIVSAVVAAHNGKISVTSSPGNTVFTVELPGHLAEPAKHGNHQASSQSSASF